MEQQKKSTQLEQSQSQEDKEQLNLIKYESVNDTPFTLVTKENKKTIITIGNQQCSPLEFDSKEEAKKYINKKTWMLITTTAMILAEKIIEQKQIKEELK